MQDRVKLERRPSRRKLRKKWSISVLYSMGEAVGARDGFPTTYRVTDISTVMSAVTMRPSSLPLPITLSHSSPMERLVFRQQQRSKLMSTSLSGGSSTTASSDASPSDSARFGFEQRQVKSLTPDRDMRCRGGARSSAPVAVGGCVDDRRVKVCGQQIATSGPIQEKGLTRKMSERRCPSTRSARVMGAAAIQGARSRRGARKQEATKTPLATKGKTTGEFLLNAGERRSFHKDATIKGGAL
jgi:hypothetical protein